MYDKDQYLYLWGCCEYFLAHAASGVSLASFDLIRKTYQGKATADAFIYERLTRPVLAKNARGIKRFVQDLVQRDRLGQLEGAAKHLAQSLKANLKEEVVQYLDRTLTRFFLESVTDDDFPETLLVLSAVYYTYYKNKEKTGMGLPPWFCSVVHPLLIKSKKGDTHKVEGWQKALKKRFTALWQGTGSTGEKLTAFFEHELTNKVLSYSLSGILGFMQEEKDKALYLFEDTHRLSHHEFKYFQILAANGFNSTLHKEKRFAVPDAGNGQALRIGVISAGQIQGIVDTAVDRYFDPALDLCVQYQLSMAGEHPRGKLLKQFDKTFLAMNREMWSELLTLADVQRRVIFRTRHLLRIIIHYLFEARGIEREFWQKYISSVNNIVHFAFDEEKNRLRRFNTLLGKRLSLYRNAQKYQGTDWEGFYRDPESRAIAHRVILELVLKARSEEDHSLPAVWFSSQVDDGVDDQALFRFFCQGLESA